MKLQLFSWLVAPGLGSLLAALTAQLLFSLLRREGLDVLPAAGACAAFAGVLYPVTLWTQGVLMPERGEAPRRRG